ncbi:MAG: hypothetical protein AABY15_00050, partial [Nanoarchaeota archaeon]
MKTILLLPILFIFTSSFGYSQNSVSPVKMTTDTTKFINDGYVPYIVGSSTIPGYDIKVMTCKDDASVTLKNGRKIAGLSCILSESSDYIGGKLIFNNDTTIIKKMTITPVGKSGARFSVRGEDF